MMSYVFTTDGVIRDELLAGDEQGYSIRNVNVGASAVIERGQLLGASAFTADFELVDDLSDVNNILGIAAADFVADDEHTVTQIYTRGIFHRERIKLGGASTFTIEPFEQELRKQNIHLRGLDEKF